MSTVSQTFTLSDGRTLGYTEYGTLSSSPPIFYAHGWPSSRLEASLWLDALHKTNAYIISTDRPGMGLSTFQPNRQILDWPQDIIELADHLAIPRFKILGASAGCPYALACAAKIPKERLVAVDIVSGLYPVSMETKTMLWSTRIQFFLLRRFSLVVEKGMDFWFTSVAKAEQGASSGQPNVFRDRTLKAMAVTSEVDKRCLADEKVATEIIEAFRESLNQGSKGMTHDGKLLGGSWGFELESIHSKTVCLWQGELDKNCHVSTAEEVIRMVSGVELKVVSKEGHLSLMVNRGEEILRHLINAGS
jgi:pimeloyl-ACP methyl ester carboxylesterase